MTAEEMRIYNAILEAGLCSMETLDLALWVGGNDLDTMNAVVTYYTGYNTWDEYAEED